jgi:hypothetical protein
MRLLWQYQISVIQYDDQTPLCPFEAAALPVAFALVDGDHGCASKTLFKFLFLLIKDGSLQKCSYNVL